MHVAIFLTGLLLWAGLSRWVHRAVSATEHWHTTYGWIDKTGKGDELALHYKVGDKEFLNPRISVVGGTLAACSSSMKMFGFGEMFGIEDPYQSYLAAMPGCGIPVYYDPQNPRHAVLYKAAQIGETAIVDGFLMSIPFVALGITFAFR